MKNWKGIWIIVVALLHTLFGISSFTKELQEIGQQGFINGINNIEQSLAAWFLLFGCLLFVIGLLVLCIEKHGQAVPKATAIVLLVINCLGVTLMPASGFWLLFPPLLAMLFYSKRSLDKADF